MYQCIQCTSFQSIQTILWSKLQQPIHNMKTVLKKVSLDSSTRRAPSNPNTEIDWEANRELSTASSPLLLVLALRWWCWGSLAVWLGPSSSSSSCCCCSLLLLPLPGSIILDETALGRTSRVSSFAEASHGNRPVNTRAPLFEPHCWTLSRPAVPPEYLYMHAENVIEAHSCLTLFDGAAAIATKTT